MISRDVEMSWRFQRKHVLKFEMLRSCFPNVTLVFAIKTGLNIANCETLWEMKGKLWKREYLRPLEAKRIESFLSYQASHFGFHSRETEISHHDCNEAIAAFAIPLNLSPCNESCKCPKLQSNQSTERESLMFTHWFCILWITTEYHSMVIWLIKFKFAKNA